MRLGLVDSTNRVAADAALAGEPEGLVVVADEQAAGRGRRGRSWVAPPGSALLCSVLCRPQCALEHFHLVTTIVGLAALDAIRETAGVAAKLKWPNDVLVGGRKLAGVLAEVVAPISPPAAKVALRPAAIVGIGLNLCWPVGWPPAADRELMTILEGATTLHAVSGTKVERDMMLGRFLAALSTRYAALSDADGAKRTMDEYRRACGTISERVRVSVRGEQWDAIAVDVADDGRLIVRRGQDEIALDVADVVHLRNVSQA